jgi:hypothetical protein
MQQHAEAPEDTYHMGLPLVHLAVAVGVPLPDRALPSPELLLGAIAPDAIHMRPGAQPGAKRQTHLFHRSEPWPEPVQAWMGTYRDAADPLRELARGYATHLLSDRLWGRTVLQEFRKRALHGRDEAGLRALYYREFDQIDMNLYRNAPWRPEVWRRLALARAHDLPGRLRAEEIDLWRARTLSWFEDPAHDPGIVPIHITEERVQAYITEAVALVREAAATWDVW